MFILSESPPAADLFPDRGAYGNPTRAMLIILGQRSTGQATSAAALPSSRMASDLNGAVPDPEQMFGLAATVALSMS